MLHAAVCCNCCSRAAQLLTPSCCHELLPDLTWVLQWASQLLVVAGGAAALLISSLSLAHSRILPAGGAAGLLRAAGARGAIPRFPGTAAAAGGGKL